MNNTYGTYGRHVICDMHGIDPELLDSTEYMIETCKIAAKKANATIVSVTHKKFQPQGLSVMILLEESHLSIHNFVEHGMCAFDCYTCSSECYPDKALEYMIEILKPDMNRVYRQDIVRGIE